MICIFNFAMPCKPYTCQAATVYRSNLDNSRHTSGSYCMDCLFFSFTVSDFGKKRSIIITFWSFNMSGKDNLLLCLVQTCPIHRLIVEIS